MSLNIVSENHPNVILLHETIVEHFPIFTKIINSRFNDFGQLWLDKFEDEMSKYFLEDKKAIKRATISYCEFSLEAMRLQKEFNQTREYRSGTYLDALKNVYLNQSYMMDTYLPALLLSHYLWPHHYRLKNWCEKAFFNLIDQNTDAFFCDVGIGTGFYSKFFLEKFINIKGYGFDISKSSITHTKKLLECWNCADRYQIIPEPVKKIKDASFDYFLCIELLEHLEKPQEFLLQLRKSVNEGALGLICAAINAPNRDHIYLYKNNKEIASQLCKSSFKILDEINFPAYNPINEDELVPQSGCFIVKAF